MIFKGPSNPNPAVILWFYLLFKRTSVQSMRTLHVLRSLFYSILRQLPVYLFAQLATWFLMVLAVSVDSNRIPYLLISPENKALTLLSNLFSKAFQELAKSRYVSVFDATAGNALCVKNTLLWSAKYFWPGNVIMSFVWSPPFSNLHLCGPISTHITTG